MCNHDGLVMTHGVLLRLGEDEFEGFFLAPYHGPLGTEVGVLWGNSGTRQKLIRARERHVPQ